jgi:uncharacterized membrane protein
MSRFLRGVLFGALLACISGPALASFSVCNATNYPALVAFGFFDGEEWSSQGWWRIDAQNCAELSSVPLLGRYYYLYGVHEEIGGAWSGNRSFCVGSDAFRIRGRSDCLARGYDRKGFYQVDTRDATEWKETLSD